MRAHSLPEDLEAGPLGAAGGHVHGGGHQPVLEQDYRLFAFEGVWAWGFVCCRDCVDATVRTFASGFVCSGQRFVPCCDGSAPSGTYRRRKCRSVGV